MKIWHVYFTDAPAAPATFRGTKAEALTAARLYIRQWQLAAKIDRIQEVTA